MISPSSEWPPMVKTSKESPKGGQTMAREERERRGGLLAWEDTRVVKEKQCCVGKVGKR